MITPVVRRRKRTSKIRATFLMVTITPADAPTHIPPAHAGVIAGVVGLVPKDHTVLV